MTIEIGQTAPDMKLVNDSGEEVALTDFKGKYVVLYFYPKDMTPGCTTEACDFRDQHESFAGLDAVIIGVSPDSRDKHENLSKNTIFLSSSSLMMSTNWRKLLMCGS